MLKAILFDLDGTLLDTDKLIFMTYKYMFDKFGEGYEPTFNEMLSFLGPTLMEVFPKYFKQNVDYLIEEYRTYNVSHHQAFVQPIYGAKDVLHAIKEKGLKIAVVTSKRKDVALLGLQLFGLDNYIDYLVDCTMVTKYKPDPEGIEMVLDEFNIRAEEALMVGDSLSDILAGINSGCKTMAVSYSLKGNFYKNQKIDYIIDSLYDILKLI